MSQIIDKDTQKLVESAVAWALSDEGRKEIQTGYEQAEVMMRKMRKASRIDYKFLQIPTV